MLMLKTLPAAKGSRNMKARLEPFSRSFWREKGRCEHPQVNNIGRGLFTSFQGIQHSKTTQPPPHKQVAQELGGSQKGEVTSMEFLVGLPGGNQGTIFRLGERGFFFPMETCKTWLGVSDTGWMWPFHMSQCLVQR